MSETLRSSGAISGAVLASRVFGLLREAVFAALFGASALADAYQVAFRVPNLLRDLFAEGAFSGAFVPTFTAVAQTEGEARARELANLAATGLLVVTGVLVTLGILFAEPIVRAMARGFDGDADKLALSVTLTQIMLPILSLVSLAAVWMGMLNAQRRFVVPALAPALFNVVSIGAGVALLLAGLSDRPAIVLWSVGTTVAAVAQAGIQLWALMHRGYRPRLRLALWLRDPGIRRIVSLMAPAVVGIAAVNLNVFINTGFAAELGDGPVTQLTFAFRLFYLPLGVFGVALATVTMTTVSEAAARGDRQALAARTADGMTAAWMLTLASAVGLFLLAEPTVRLIFLRGAMTSADAAAVAEVLRAYLFGLVPYSLVKLLAPGFYGIDRPRIPMVASIIGVTVNLGFNAATYRTLGAPGIALGTSLGALANLLVLRVAFARIVGPLPVEQGARRWGALLLGVVVLAGVLLGLGLAAEFASRQGLTQRAVDLVWVGVAVPLGFAGFAGTLAALKYPGAGMLLAMPRRLARGLSDRLRRRGTL